MHQSQAHPTHKHDLDHDDSSETSSNDSFHSAHESQHAPDLHSNTAHLTSEQPLNSEHAPPTQHDDRLLGPETDLGSYICSHNTPSGQVFTHHIGRVPPVLGADTQDGSVFAVRLPGQDSYAPFVGHGPDIGEKNPCRDDVAHGGYGAQGLQDCVGVGGKASDGGDETESPVVIEEKISESPTVIEEKISKGGAEIRDRHCGLGIDKPEFETDPERDEVRCYKNYERLNGVRYPISSRNMECFALLVPPGSLLEDNLEQDEWYRRANGMRGVEYNTWRRLTEKWSAK